MNWPRRVVTCHSKTTPKRLPFSPRVLRATVPKMSCPYQVAQRFAVLLAPIRRHEDTGRIVGRVEHVFVLAISHSLDRPMVGTVGVHRSEGVGSEEVSALILSLQVNSIQECWPMLALHWQQLQGASGRIIMPLEKLLKLLNIENDAGQTGEAHVGADI